MSAKEGTVQFEIKLRLPHSVAQEAEARGLLEPESLESLLREELRRRRIDRLFEAADRLQAIPLPPLTEAEIEAEVQAVRSPYRWPDLSVKGQGLDPGIEEGDWIRIRDFAYEGRGA